MYRLNYLHILQMQHNELVLHKAEIKNNSEFVMRNSELKIKIKYRMAKKEIIQKYHARTPQKRF